MKKTALTYLKMEQGKRVKNFNFLNGNENSFARTTKNVPQVTMNSPRGFKQENSALKMICTKCSFFLKLICLCQKYYHKETASNNRL